MSGKKRKKTAKKRKKTKSGKMGQKPMAFEEIPGWMLLVFSATLLISLMSFAYAKGPQNWLGLAGYTVGWLTAGLLGLSGYLFALYLGWMGWRRFFGRPINDPYQKHLSITMLIFATSMLLTLVEGEFPHVAESLGHFFYTQLWEKKLRFHLGGAPAYFLYHDLPFFNFHDVINVLGVAFVFLGMWFAGFFLLFRINPMQFFNKVVNRLRQLPAEDEKSFLRYVKLRIPGYATPKSSQKEPAVSEMLEIKPEKNLLFRPSLSRKALKETEPAPFEAKKEKTKLQEPSWRQAKKERALTAQRVYNGDFAEYALPSQTLLTHPKKVDQSSLKKDLRRQAEVLEETLLSFGIEAKVGQINCGPTITSFEVHPSIGVKVQKIKSLENDIALNMEAKSIRILAPIPGKAAIGIEVPNAKPQEVGFKDMLASYLQRGKKFAIPVLLGKTVNGEYVMEDLAKMPHLIIAGATGSGKSVCINTIVMSILMTAKPDEIKLLMVDPKKVELTPYSKLPHMLAPVITEPGGACASLNWLVKEMEKRYEVLKTVGLRNIASFNSRKIDREFEEALEKQIPEKLPYIVCIIDELADLMMVSSNDIETYIARIAQMARAVGIHMILATQRPSREVITGLIKANFPTRISFKVSSRINSQIILDEVGAESLLGNGDMLFLPPGSHHLVRAQGAYIRDQDINGIVDFLCRQAPPKYVIASFDHLDGDEKDMLLSNEEPKDALYEKALNTVLATGNASTTFLQRKLKVGYPKAASLIDQLEAEGVLGPAQGSKPREILVKNEKPRD